MDRAAISEAARRILDQDPDPVVRWRLLRDVLRRPPDGARAGAAGS